MSREDQPCLEPGPATACLLGAVGAERTTIAVEFNGAGRIPGFAVVDMTASWKAWQLELFGKVTNLFDRQYATAGLLGENAFDSFGPAP